MTNLSNMTSKGAHGLSDDDRNKLAAELAAKDREAHLLGRQGQHANAEAILRANLDTRRNILQLSGDDPHVLNNIGNLGGQLKDQNKFTEAETLFREILETETRIYGLEHSNTICDLNNLAEVFSHQGHYDEAAEMQDKALTLGAKVYGESNMRYLLIKENFGNILARKGEFVKAETILREAIDGFQALAMRRQEVGTDSEDEMERRPEDASLMAMNNLASVLGRMGKPDKAIAMFKVVVEQEKDDLGKSISLANLSVELKRLGRFQEAEPAMRESLKIMARCVGNEDWRVKAGMEDLKGIMRKLGRDQEAEKISIETLLAESQVAA